MSDLPELKPNQIGVSCKIFNGHGFKFEDETLYFTINKTNVAMELYPKKPVIIIDKDAIKMILKKINELEKPESIQAGTDPEKTTNEADQFPFQNNQDTKAMTASADAKAMADEAGADSNELNDLQDNGEVEAGKAAILEIKP